MGEIETTEQEEDTTAKTGEEGADTSTNDGADDGDEDGSDADDNKDDDTEDGDDDQDADKEKSKADTSKDDEQEPPTRKRPIDFIKERQERKAAKQTEKKSKGADDEDDDAEDDIDPEDEKTIGKVVSRRLKEALEPFAQAEAQKQDEAEIASFLQQNPDFKPYEAKARKYMAHPSRKDVPIEEIFYGVAGRDLLKIGAKRSKIADDEAKKTKSPSGSQAAGGAKSNNDLSKDELEAKQAAVRAKMADRY